MNRGLLTVMAFINFLTWGTSAQVDGYRGEFSGILKYLRTPPVEVTGVIVDAALASPDSKTLVALLGGASSDLVGQKNWCLSSGPSQCISGCFHTRRPGAAYGCE